MVEVSVREAKIHLAKLVQKAASGEEVVLTQNNRPVARIVKSDGEASESRKASRIRHPGNSKGVVIYMAEDFDAPLDDFKDYM